MRISEEGQITIPKHLLDRFDMRPNTEVEITPTASGLLIQRRTANSHPVERVRGILKGVRHPAGFSGNTDDYLDEVRGR